MSLSTRSLLRCAFLSAGLGLFSLAAATPSHGLELTSSGWIISPSSPGECPTANDFGCYENLTATTIDLIGRDSSLYAATTYSYNLPTSSPQQLVSFTYFFNTDGNTISKAFYRLSSSFPVNLPSDQAGNALPFLWSPGETLTFSIDQGNSLAWAGTLSISAFSSEDTTQPVPAPLPLASTIIFYRWQSLRQLSKRLRPKISAERQ